MKKSAYLLVLAAGLVLAGCGSTDVSSSSGESGSSTTGESSSSLGGETASSSDIETGGTHTSSSSAEEGTASSESSSSSSSSEAGTGSSESSSEGSSSEIIPAVPEVMKTPEGLKSVFDGVMAKKVAKWSVDINSQSMYSSANESITHEVATDEALTTTVNKAASPATTEVSYYGLIGDVYYTVDSPNQSNRYKVVEDASATSNQYMTAEDVRANIDFQIESNSLENLFDNWDTNAGDPWYGGNKSAATSITVVAAISDLEGYHVTVTAYYEAPQDSYGQCYTYTGIFDFVDGEADAEGNPTYDLTGVIATLTYCEIASWNYETHAIVTGGTSYTNTVMAYDIVYGEAPATDEKAPLLENLEDFYVSGIEGAPSLTGQSGYDDLGEPIFQTGDSPSLSYDTVFAPATALNGRSIGLTGASDPEALAPAADSWSGPTFAKAGTFDLYFGDAVEPELIVIEDVTVQERGASIPLFPMQNQFSSTTANGAAVTSTTDWSTMETSASVTLPLGADTAYLRINPETGSEDEVFDLTAISVDIDDPTILDVTLGSDMTIDYNYGCWLLPIELDVKAAGTATVTFTSAGEGSMGMGTSNVAKLVVTAVDGELAFQWSSLEAIWNTGALAQNGFPFDIIAEPTFEYERATLTVGTWIDMTTTLKIYVSDAGAADLYKSQLLDLVLNIYGTDYYFEDVSTEETGTNLAFRSAEYPMGNAAISYDAAEGCVVVVWTVAE